MEGLPEREEDDDVCFAAMFLMGLTASWALETLTIS